MLGWRISFEGGSKGVSPGRVHPMLGSGDGMLCPIRKI